MNRENDNSLLQQALSAAPKLVDQYPSQQDYALNGLHNPTIDPRYVDDPSDDGPAEKKVIDLFSQNAPANASDLKSADSDIAAHMAELSVTDREEAYMDVHGISDHCLTTETPELIAKSLSDLQQEINNLPDRRAYSIAERMNPHFVHDREFRLMFLRCERFDCSKAALRIIRRFQMKIDLFGVEKLAMDITQDDLDAEDMEVLYGCSGRFLKAVDSGGRLINFILTHPRTYETDAVLRKSFYNIMVEFRDPEIQRRGAINIGFHLDTGKGLGGGDPDLLWKLPKLNEGSPMRLSAIHFCWNDAVWEERQAILKSALSKPLKVRIKVHRGSVQECLGELRRHGIDPTCIPINDNCEMTDLAEERRKLEAQRLYERFNFPPRTTILVPFSRDVLVGKGTPIQNHPGNKVLRQLFSDHMKQYDKAKQSEKYDISFGIIETIRQSGGLFLKQEGKKWVRVDDDVARLKVTAAFRTSRFIKKHNGN